MQQALMKCNSSLKVVSSTLFPYLTAVKNKFVVAIGSSAGGLDPMLSFFDFAPHDEATYVILRHVPIDHQSKLHNVLEWHTKLKIVEAQNDTLIEKDTIYIPPASMYMTIKNDRLYLQKRIEHSLFPNYCVDVFLNTLAEAKGNKCIAVILSGSGSDGTKVQLQLIKQAVW